MSTRYRLARIYVRWGKTENSGSEHRINDRGFAAEVQLVHHKASMTYDKAESQSDGLAVVSVLVKHAVRKTNAALNFLAKHSSKIMNKTQRHHFKANSTTFSPRELLAIECGTTEYWTYSGSQTWHPYTENSIWIILRRPIEVMKKQLAAFRQLHEANVRRIQPLNDRLVRASFHLTSPGSESAVLSKK